MEELTVKKFKTVDKDRLILAFDRLTRFKQTDTKYLRVFYDILTTNLIEPKFKKQELEKLDNSTIAHAVEFILNKSLDALVGDVEPDYRINQRIFECESALFKLDENSKKLVNNKINYSAAVKLLTSPDLPLNLKWLKLLSIPNYTEELSHSHALKFPIKKVIICEGITEEILLPEFAKVLNFDFNKNGVQMISAGGKNQVVKLFYELSSTLNVPIFVLLDSDAKTNYDEIKPRLRTNDKVHILKNGEFEDIISEQLIEKTLNASIANISATPSAHPDKTAGMVRYLEEFYKNRGTHEFKKSEFAQAVKENIKDQNDVSEEFKTIVEELKTT